MRLNLNKTRVLFVGAFKDKGKDGSVGGQMFACKTLVESELSEKVDWILIDTTAKTNKHRSLITRLTPGFIRFIKVCYHILFSNIDTVLAFSSSGLSLIEKGLMIGVAKLFNKKTILALRSGYLIDEIENDEGFRNRVSKIFTKCDYIICQGVFWKEFLEQKFDLKDSKLKIILNWINLEKYKDLKINQNKSEIVNILFLGWITKNKGVYEIIEAVKTIDREDFVINMAGDGDAFEDIKKLIEKNKLQNKIKMLGWCYEDEKNKLLKEADILLLPSYREGFPNAILEGIASATAVIATSVGGIPDVIFGDNGTIIEPKNADQIKKAIINYLDNRELIRTHAKNSYKFIQQNNTLEVILPKLKELF